MSNCVECEGQPYLKACEDRDHTRIPPAPAAPVAESRGDEAEMYVSARQWAIDKLAGECSRGELSDSLVSYRVEDFIKDAYAAGRARGEAEMRTRGAERAAQLINDLIDGRQPLIALALLEARNAIIADAIARRRTP